MAFIKAQKIVRDDSGAVISGSAAVVDSVYVKTGSNSHSRQEVREKLGKVLYLSEDKKVGIFLSPTRGLVEYNASTDAFSEVDRSDPRINAEEFFPEPEVHTVFGDAYLLLQFLEKCGLISVLRSVFPKDEAYERVLCHILHGVLRDGSRISCDNFIDKSFASYMFGDVPVGTLHSDTRFFTLLGDDRVKMSFFKAFVTYMQKKDPSFGKGCYVDSTPLPNDMVMTRLILVLDEASSLPVWYDIIPGNVLDINTIMTIVNDVADSLGIEIDSLVLDAGYVSKDLVGVFHIGTEKTVIGRMPARKGYPHKTLYWEVKDLINRGKYAFVRKHHAYFGFRKEIELFGHREYAYIYVDQYNALKRFSDYLSEHEEEFAELKLKDKDWMTVKYGYFVLISNRDLTPKELLSEYFGRTDIEVVFKTSKEYLDLLPLSKWTDQTVRGKILHDIIDTIVLLMIRKSLKHSGKSTSEIFGKCQALMCSKNSRGIVNVETPSKHVKEYYKLLQIPIPSYVELSKYTGLIMKPKM